MKQFLVCFSGSRSGRTASMQPIGTLWKKRQTQLSLSTCRISILCWHFLSLSLSLSFSFFLSNTQFNYFFLFEFSFHFATSSPVRTSFDQSCKIFVSWAYKTLNLLVCMLFKTNTKPRLTVAAQLRRRETWLSLYSSKIEKDAVDSFFDNHGFCILFTVQIGNK